MPSAYVNIKSAHDCEMPPEVDEMPKVFPGTGCYHRLRRWFRGICVVAADNPRTTTFLRSRAAINSEKRRHINNYPFMIHPFSHFRSLWEIYMSLVFLISLLMVPMITSFSISGATTEWRVASLFLDLLCLGDIVMTFFTGDFDMTLQEVILDPKDVARRYITEFFFIDLLSTIPLDYIVSESVSEESDNENQTTASFYIGLFRILKIFRIKALILYFNSIVLVYKLPEISSKVIKTSVIVFIYVHWVAGIEFQVPLMVAEITGQQTRRSWIYVEGLINASKAEKYVMAMFRAISVTCRAGYGHTIPYESEDMIVFCILSMVGEVIFVLIVALSMQIFYILNTSVAKYEEISLQLREYMRHKQLPEQFQTKLMAFYEYKFHKSYFREKDILSSLTGQLRQDIILHSCRHLVENVVFFRDLSPSLLVRIVSCLRSEIFLSNQVIVKSGTRGESMYFIATGTVAVFTAFGKEVCHLQDGSHFGEVSLITDDRLRVASVVAVESCELYRLDRMDFLRTVLPYEDLLQKIQEIASLRLQELHGLDATSTVSAFVTQSSKTTLNRDSAISTVVDNRNEGSIQRINSGADSNISNVN